MEVSLNFGVQREITISVWPARLYGRIFLHGQVQLISIHVYSDTWYEQIWGRVGGGEREEGLDLITLSPPPSILS